ncbi:unnamed protein product [Orchesella dallaii]|uniref:Uncharacterized protein n=1 Tax=Orchesella dallaii TaxID=48710 RepID=A0ABP1QAB3_9HEXA
MRDLHLESAPKTPPLTEVQNDMAQQIAHSPITTEAHNRQNCRQSPVTSGFELNNFGVSSRNCEDYVEECNSDEDVFTDIDSIPLPEILSSLTNWSVQHNITRQAFDTYADASLYVKDALFTSDLSACEKSGRRKKKDKPSNILPAHPSETSHVSVTAPAEVPVIVPAEVPVAPVPEVPTLVLVSDDSVGHNLQGSNQNFVILPRQEAHHCNCEEFQKDVILKLQVLEECFLQQTELLRCVLEKVTNKPVDICVEGDYKFEPNQFPIKDMNSLDGLIQLVTDNKKVRNETRLRPTAGPSLGDNVLNEDDR